jgi:non-specific protein-tyrosine kinase
MEMDNIPIEQMDEGLDLRQYFSLFWHWAWLILLAALLAGATSYFLSSRMTPFYQSTTTVLLNAAPATKATDYSSVMMSEQLTSTYSQMMAKDPVLSQVAEQVGLANPLADIKKWITVTPIRDTQLIQVAVETTDPELSAEIANAVVTVFAAQIQEIQSERFSQSKATLESQLADTEKQISTYSTQAERAIIIEEKARLDTKVAQYREMYSNLLLSYEQVRLAEAQSVSSVVQVEPATPNFTPVKPKIMQNTLLAAVVGFLMAAGAIAASEALDDTIKTPDDISRKFKLPVLGVINHHATEANSPITLTDPRSPTAEAYRTLRTNVSYTSVDRPLRSLMVTSAEPGEGKTTTVSNLGVVMAQNGKEVIIADCDLRHPRVHTFFGLANRLGLSTLFAQTSIVIDGIPQPTQVEHLSVVATGLLPPNPAELMGSQKMQSILTSMSQSADMILIDTPPILAVTDAAVLAPSMDGVLLVVRPGKTHTSGLRQTLEQLRQVNARVLGVVLNDVITRGRAYGYHYKYYRDYAAYQNYHGTKAKGKNRKKT